MDSLQHKKEADASVFIHESVWEGVTPNWTQAETKVHKGNKGKGKGQGKGHGKGGNEDRCDQEGMQVDEDYGHGKGHGRGQWNGQFPNWETVDRLA